MQRRIVHSGAGEVVCVDAVVACVRMVRGHISSVGGDGGWRRKVQLLPARGGFTRKGARGQQATGA
jgi:hypothetical protein